MPIKLGLVIGDNANFFGELQKALDRHYSISQFIFQPINPPVMSGRINDWRFQREFENFSAHQDVLFFEWAGERLVKASHFPKHNSVIVRLLGYELYTWAPLIDWHYVDIITVPLQAVKREFSRLYPKHAHKCVVVPTGLNLSDYDPTPQPYRGHLGILGNILPRKRVYELILAVADMVSYGLDVHLFIAGTHPERFEREYLATLRLPEISGITDRVIFDGYVLSSSWLKKIDIFISNSYSETQHVALQEAMASGCYCLAHFWDGVEEFMPPENIYISNHQLIEKVASYERLSIDEKVSRQQILTHLVGDLFDSRKTVQEIIRLVNKLVS